MNKVAFLPLLALILMGAGCANTTDTQTDTLDTESALEAQEQLALNSDEMAQPNEDALVDSGETNDPASEVAVKTFTVSGNNFGFDPAIITVKKGDKVRLTFDNVEGFHDLVIDEFEVATKQIRGGESQTVEFVADKAGSFEYYCSVGKHREMGMKGTLIVQ